MSLIGAFRTWCDIRLESVMRTKTTFVNASGFIASRASSAAAITFASGLHWRAGNRTVGAKYAAMSRQRLQPLTAFLAVIEKLARVG
jgi:hypothetical protein